MNRDGRGRSPTVFPQMMKPPMQPMMQMLPNLQAAANTPKFEHVAGLMLQMMQQSNNKMNDSGAGRTVQQ